VDVRAPIAPIFPPSGAPPVAAPLVPAHESAPGQPTTNAPAKADEDEHAKERSGFTKALTLTALVGGAAKGIVIDRVRLVTALPHARSQGKTGKWLAEMVSGKITNDIVPIKGGTLTLFGKTITEKAWQHSYQVSNGIGLAMLGVNMLYGIPNLIEGWNDGDGTFGGLMGTRQGRTGVFATAGNVFAMGVMAAAYAKAPAGAGRIAETLRSPIMSNGKVILAGIGFGIPVMLNELGFLDFSNTGSKKDWLENARDTTANHLDSIKGWLHLGD
jgi:hypothetical protein